MLNIIPNPKSVKETGGFYKKNGAVFSVSTDSSMEEAAYKITITSEEINLVVGSSIGEQYARTTLSFVEDKGVYPCCEIEDQPDYEHRGFMLDVARRFVGVRFIKHYLDILAKFKFNRFHWHLSDDHGFRIDLTCAPELKESNLEINKVDLPKEYRDESYERGYYTIEEVKDVIEYANSLHILIIPEIDMPGHLSAAFHAYPYHTCDGKQTNIESTGGIFYGIGCISNPKFIQFAKEIVSELASIFPGPYIHLGGDEVPTKNWEECPTCQAFMQEKAMKEERELQVYFENQLIETCLQHGKRAICWNDIIEDGVKKDVIGQFWTGIDHDEGRKHKERMMQQLNQGRKHIMSYHGRTYLDMPYEYCNLYEVYHYNPATMPGLDTIKEGMEEHILGVECAMWTEYAHDKKRLEYQLFPRLIAFAEVGWNKEKDWEGFKKRYHALEPTIKEMDIEQADISKFKEVYTEKEQEEGLKEFYCENKEDIGMLSYRRYKNNN